MYAEPRYGLLALDEDDDDAAEEPLELAALLKPGSPIGTNEFGGAWNCGEDASDAEDEEEELE